MNQEDMSVAAYTAYVTGAKKHGWPMTSKLEQCRNFILYELDGIVYRFWTSGAYAGSFCTIQPVDMEYFKLEYLEEVKC